MPMMFGFAQHRRQLLEGELARMLPELAPFGALRAYLVGVLARGTVGPESELELVLVQETAEPFRRRPDFWTAHLRPKCGTRFLVYTPEEFETLADEDPILLAAQRWGEALFG
jgi:hypothetical protein